MVDFWGGFFGALGGAIVAVVVTWVNHRLKTENARRLDDGRKKLLRQMLKHKPAEKQWRSIEALSAVIGASYDDTARLLIEIGARGSETGSGVWAFVDDKPLRGTD